MGTTKFSFLRLMALGKDCLFSFSKKPLTLATTFGSITLLIGLIWAATILVQSIFGEGGGSIVSHYLIVSSHILAGAILLAIGILGEYVGRIWEQVRSRPNYLLKFDSHAEARPLPHQPPHIRVFESAVEHKSHTGHESA
jgi:dolichol-phosphate mannosyltransferase